MSDRLWKVRVDCYQQDVAEPTVRWFLVNEEAMAEAVKSALYAAESSCEFGPRWTEFVWRQANSVLLPYEIKV
jgi:hypothetical protein